MMQAAELWNLLDFVNGFEMEKRATAFYFSHLHVFFNWKIVVF